MKINLKDFFDVSKIEFTEEELLAPYQEFFSSIVVMSIVMFMIDIWLTIKMFYLIMPLFMLKKIQILE